MLFDWSKTTVDVAGSCSSGIVVLVPLFRRTRERHCACKTVPHTIHTYIDFNREGYRSVQWWKLVDWNGSDQVQSQSRFSTIAGMASPQLRETMSGGMSSTNRFRYPK